MKKIWISFCLLVVSSAVQAQTPAQTDAAKALLQTPVQASTQTPAQTKALDDVFSVEYASTTKKQEVPLKNTKLTAKIYYYGNPMGIEEIAVDQDQHISLDKYKNKSRLVLEVLSLSDQSKYDSACRGSNKIGKKNIVIMCKEDKTSKS